MSIVSSEYISRYFTYRCVCWYLHNYRYRYNLHEWTYMDNTFGICIPVSYIYMCCVRSYIYVNSCGISVHMYHIRGYMKRIDRNLNIDGDNKFHLLVRWHAWKNKSGTASINTWMLRGYEIFCPLIRSHTVLDTCMQILRRCLVFN